MRVNWILEHLSIEKYEQEVLTAIAEYGDVPMVFKPFWYLSFDKSLFYEDRPTVSLCSIGGAQWILNKTALVPGTYYDVKPFEVNTYYRDYRKFMLNENYLCVPLWLFKEDPNRYFDILGNNNCLFVRPNFGGKSFTGCVLDRDSKDIDDISHIAVNDYELLCLSEPKNISREWRLVIIDKQIIAGSLYKENGKKFEQEGFPNEVRLFAENVLSSVANPPQRAYTMDVGQMSDELKIVELNSMSCSGLYSCRVRPILDNLRRIAIEDFNDYHS